MIEDLTSDLTSINSISTAIDSGIKEAFRTVHDATKEAQIKVSRFFDNSVE
jgi:hypothetical protein